MRHLSRRFGTRCWWLPIKRCKVQNECSTEAVRKLGGLNQSDLNGSTNQQQWQTREVRHTFSHVSKQGVRMIRSGAVTVSAKHNQICVLIMGNPQDQIGDAMTFGIVNQAAGSRMRKTLK